jgi:hypothetical protein
MSRFRLIALSAILVVVAGCVSKPVEAEKLPPPLMIAQNSDGEVNLAWDSEAGYIYTIYYQDSEGADWMPLKSADRIRGTGETLTVQDRINPNLPPRRYRLLQDELKP